MATVYEIIQGINQAATNAYDGSHVEEMQADGRPRIVGLEREEGHYINDRRVMDGFKVSFHGPLLRIKYQAEVRIKDVKNNGFEDDIISKLKDIVKFLKKEYKTITGNALALTLEGDHHILVQRMSNYRTDCQAHCDYRIGGMNDVDAIAPDVSREIEDNAVRSFLDQAAKGRAPNDTRKGK